MKIHIETSRLILRDIEADDLQGLFELDSDPEVHRYLGGKPIKSLQEAEGIIAYIRKQYEDDGIGRWAVAGKASGEFIGWAGLKYERSVRETPYFDLGYRLKRRFWGQGIATEAAQHALSYGFREMGLQQVFAGAHIENAGSNRVLQKIGLNFLETFEFDGALHHWYGLGRAEWAEKKQPSH
ncbi:GNAT family N-acetyltransferase [Phaeodactylibacter luteus]|uniref:GNAT family N-acetyltransferase n=1 Tax=Phaeodactylibacter luteus TaxID=1564516 RepID=A0A5C6RP62_9BACT|nr:GNAT family N-acetyltransferase [Phaeodactylibacter luteus]TXB63764.1 GNAT family N-acetyltransferase [Phaeodactylibacter luteus]